MKNWEAMKLAIEEGKKIRHSSWDADKFIYLNYNHWFNESGGSCTPMTNEMRDLNNLIHGWEEFNVPPKLVSFQEAYENCKEYGFKYERYEGSAQANMCMYSHFNVSKQLSYVYGVAERLRKSTDIKHTQKRVVAEIKDWLDPLFQEALNTLFSYYELSPDETKLWEIVRNYSEPSSEIIAAAAYLRSSKL